MEKLKTIVLITFGTLILLFLIILISFKTMRLSSVIDFLPTPTPVGGYSVNSRIPVNTPVSSLQKTLIYQTTEDEVKKRSDILSSDQIDQNTVRYEVRSVNPLAPDEIITNNGKVVFERTSTFTSDPGGLPKFSTFKSEFGEPDEIVYGNQNWDETIDSLIYFSKGFVLIGRQQTDEIFEILRFAPTTREDFFNKYGNYVKTLPPSDAP